MVIERSIFSISKMVTIIIQIINNSHPINSVCTSWFKGVRRILNLPHDAHSRLLGPLLKQNHSIRNDLLLELYAFYFGC